jgi:O-antigen/teichoic acid export membrane protein
LLQVALARWMGASGYGAYAVALGWVTLASTICAIGLPDAALRFLPEYSARNEWREYHGYIRIALAVTLGTGLALALVGTAVAVVLAASGVGGFWLILAAIWLVPLLAVTTLQSSLIRALHRMVGAYGPSLVLRPVLVILGAWILFRANRGLAAGGAVFITAAALLPIIFLQRGLVAKAADARAARAAPSYRLRTWLHVAGPLFLVSSFVIVLTQADIVLLATLRGAREAGFYTAATKTAALVSFFLAAVNAVSAPMIASLYARGHRGELQRLVTLSAHWIFWPSLACAMGLALFGGHVLDLFGHGFHTARGALLILLIGQMFSAAAGSVGFLLNLTGHHIDAARVFGISAVTNLALNVVGIKLFGMIGAASATAVSFVLWNAWLYILVQRRIGVRSSIVGRLQDA